MPGYTGGLWRGSQGPSPPPTVLGKADCGGEGGSVLWFTLPHRERGYPGRLTAAHHFQCGGRCGGLPPEIPAGGGTGGGREKR